MQNSLEQLDCELKQMLWFGAVFVYWNISPVQVAMTTSEIPSVYHDNSVNNSCQCYKGIHKLGDLFYNGIMLFCRSRFGIWFTWEELYVHTYRLKWSYFKNILDKKTRGGTLKIKLKVSLWGGRLLYGR